MEFILFAIAVGAALLALWAYGEKVAAERSMLFGQARESRLNATIEEKNGRIVGLQEENRVLRIAKSELDGIKAQRAAALAKARAANAAKAAAKKSGAA
jgi:hypothetical protein